MILIQLEIIEQQSVGERVFDQFIGMLRDGDWKPGDKLPAENSLALSLGVSRITVRGALHKLESLGLIESQRGGGRYVCESDASAYVQALIPEILLDRPPIADLFDFRYMLEMGSIPLAVEAGTAKELSALRDILKKMEGCTANEKQLETLEIAFHTTFGNMTGNSILKKIYQTFKNILFSSGGGLLHASSPQEMLALYDNLLVSLEEKDIEGAKAAMDASLNIIRKSFGRVKKGE